MEKFKCNSVYFYYNSKNIQNKMLINFKLGDLDIREKYFLEGMFLPNNDFKIPKEGHIEFNRKETEILPGEFTKFKRDLNFL